MKVRVIKVGKPAFPEYRTLVAEYEKRLKKFASFEVLEVKAETFSPKHVLICLDENGKQWPSVALSKKIAGWQMDPRVVGIDFLIGGAYGLEKKTLEAADELWSLSKATLPGDLAWLVAVEQIYRGFMILSGSGYHHG